MRPIENVWLLLVIIGIVICQIVNVHNVFALITVQYRLHYRPIVVTYNTFLEVPDLLPRLVTKKCRAWNYFIFDCELLSLLRALSLKRKYRCRHARAIFAFAIFEDIVLLHACIAIGPWPFEVVFVGNLFELHMRSSSRVFRRVFRFLVLVRDSGRPIGLDLAYHHR